MKRCVRCILINLLSFDVRQTSALKLDGTCLNGCQPENYAARASRAVKTRRTADPQGNIASCDSNSRNHNSGKVYSKLVTATEEDVIYIKMIPGMKEKKLVIKEEAEEAEETEEMAELEYEKQEEEEAIDIDEEESKDRKPKKKEIQEALKMLEEASKQKAKGYEKLRKAVPTLDDAAVEAISN